MANELQTKLDTILLDKNTNLLPENLKKNITCLGITGTYEGSGGGTVEGIKQFATQEEMQADPAAKEGDLAVVYRNEIKNATVDSKFQTATFPETVVLDTSITDNIEVRYRAVDSSIMFECMGQLDSSNFMMDCYSDSGEVRIEYTSSDGITYTRTDTTGNPVDFGTEIYYEMPEMWNDAIGKFIQASGNAFEGLYKAENKLTHTVNYNYRLENGEVKYDSVEYNFDQLYEDLRLSHSNGSSLKLVSNYAEGKPTRYWSSGYANQCLIHYNGYIYFGCTSSNDIASNYTVYYRDIGGSDVYPDISTATKVTINSTNYYIFTASQTVDDDNIRYFCDNAASASFPMYYIENNTVYNIPIVANTGNYYPQWILAPTQLTTAPDYVYEKEFYGKNGIEIGTLQNKENLTKDGVKRRVDIWANYSSGIVCPSNLSSMFRGRTDLTSIPLLDTSSVTDMDSMFYGCTNLTTIPLLDTSSVTNMHFMFADCANLTTIPELNTSKVTNMGYMFRHCTNLTTIPELNTSKVTDMAYMFYGCTNLTTVPLLDISSVTYMSFMFANCTSLSEESLNNILAMCINATSYTTNTKTLKQLGLTSEQATKCTTLSNYSAFTSAGWTTGY